MSQYDVIVVGAGMAGMRAAVAAHESGAQVALISKVHPLRSQSGMATALNAAFRADDRWEDHMFDTVKGSDYLGDQDVIEFMCRNGGRDALELERFGLIYSRDPSGGYTQKPRGSGGQNYPRSIYVADKTGHFIQKTLYQQILKRNITLLYEWFVLRVVADDRGVVGLVALEMRSGRIEPIPAQCLVFCTGGYGQVFGRSTNALITTGDGMALAARAGIPLKDMEFVQFHPTSLYGTNILMSEACRSMGGYLRNAQGERFMAKHAPNKVELATRDIVARGIQQEIDEGRGIDGKPYIHLDLRHLGRETILKALPKNRDLAMEFAGVDPIYEPIPVQPAQHYSMGGIEADVTGATRVEGIFAAGECACHSVHGANRLGGNSLLDTIVFGKAAGAAAAALSRERNSGMIPDSILADVEVHLSRLLKKTGKETVPALKRSLGDLMMAKAGIRRDAQGLAAALEGISEVKERLRWAAVRDHSRVFNYDLLGTLELENSLLLAEAIAQGAKARQESRGSHSRLDFPDRDDDQWLKHSLVLVEGQNMKLEYRPVTITRFKPAERKY